MLDMAYIWLIANCRWHIQTIKYKQFHCTHVERLIGSFENGSTKGVVLPVHYPKDDLALWASVSSPVTTKKAYSGFCQVLAF